MGPMDKFRADDKALHAQIVDEDQRTAAGLAVLAQALRTFGAVVDTSDPMAPGGEVTVYADRLDPTLAQRLIDSLTDVAEQDWTGTSGARYRDHAGTLFGRTIKVIELLD